MDIWKLVERRFSCLKDVLSQKKEMELAIKHILCDYSFFLYVSVQ